MGNAVDPPITVFPDGTENAGRRENARRMGGGNQTARLSGAVGCNKRIPRVAQNSSNNGNEVKKRTIFRKKNEKIPKIVPRPAKIDHLRKDKFLIK